MDWRHIDLEERVWRQPGRLTKNRDAHELRLNPLALEILTRRWEATGRPKAGLVFPSPRSGAPITAFSGVLRALHRAAPAVERWALHDLRRSFATTLGRLGQDDEATIDAVLNHRQSATRGGVVGVYNKSTRLPAQHAALERWGGLVADALEGRIPEGRRSDFARATSSVVIILAACAPARNQSAGLTTVESNSTDGPLALYLNSSARSRQAKRGPRRRRGRHNQGFRSHRRSQPDAARRAEAGLPRLPLLPCQFRHE